MIPFEKQYMDNLKKIYYEGAISLNERTGIETLRVPSTQFVVDLQQEFPILQSKTVQWKTAVKEILWIMQKQSNRTQELGAHIWDAWADEEGTIGKAYGYQVAKPVKRGSTTFLNQVDYVLQTLKKDNSNRQCVIDLWNVEDLSEMNLVPCCYSTVWNIINGRLNCMLVQRSADYPVGVPFDVTQYAVLTHMFARHLGVQPGVLTHVMADSHIYLNQIEGVKTLLDQYGSFCTYRHDPVTFTLSEDTSESFFGMKLENCVVNNYNPLPAVKFPVAT